MAAYDEFERKTLVDLVKPHRSIIDSKKVDADTLSKKREIWLKITNEYNQHTRVRKRLTKQLRRLWENTKARWKKESSMSGSSTKSSIAHLLLNESTSDDQIMETIQMENNREVDQTSESDKVFVIQNGNTARIVNAKGERLHPKKKHRFDDDNPMESSATSLINDDQEPGVAEVLAPVIAARVKRNDEAMEQQKELHQLVVQRERLQIRILEEQLAKQTEDHSLKLERDRELHDLKLRQEQEFHIQRLRHEQEIHQMRLAEYNKMQLASYHTAIG